MSNRPIITLLRRDLRLEDNPALYAAGQSHAPIIPLFVLDDDEAHAPGEAGRWWLHQSLTAFDADLKRSGLSLTLLRGPLLKTLQKVVKETDAGAVYWNRRYAPAHVEADKALMKSLSDDDGLKVKSFNGALLREPWEIETKSGGPYQIFTPFWKALLRSGPGSLETLSFRSMSPGNVITPPSEKLRDWGLLPKSPNWAEKFSDYWEPGEKGARKVLETFLDGSAFSYRENRNRPDRIGTSRLSPHLTFGEISPKTIWRAVYARVEAQEISESEAQTFLSEIAWREFYYSLLYYNDDLRTTPMSREFTNLKWRRDKKAMLAWRRGLTGYPIVDAGMRELWRTGWMHNRVRMIVASFLVKDLLLPWQEGERWFWDTLVDADPANNGGNWQWVAGCGADAAPYFRIFNPVTQGKKFDPNGAYIRQYVPELSTLPDVFIHEPWRAPTAVLEQAGIQLRRTYPAPVIEHDQARKRALEAYENAVKRGGE